MTTPEVLDIILERGIFPAVVRGRLVLIEPVGYSCVTPKLKQVLKYHRERLIKLLRKDVAYGQK